MIASCQFDDLFLFQNEVGLQSMSIVFTLHVDELSSNVANGTILIGHLSYLHVACDRDLFLLVHDKVIVTIQYA